MTRVFVADADPNIRSSLVLLLKHKLDIQEIREIEDACQLDEHLGICRPDVLLLDWELPGLDFAQVRRRVPAGEQQPVLVVMSVHAHIEPRAIASGADAFLCKFAPGETVLDLLREYIARR